MKSNRRDDWEVVVRKWKGRWLQRQNKENDIGVRPIVKLGQSMGNENPRGDARRQLEITVATESLKAQR